VTVGRGRRPLLAPALAAALVSPAATRAAGGDARIVTGEIAATSAVGSASKAFDADAATVWCPSPTDPDGTLTVAFGHEVTIKSLTLFVGRMPRPGTRDTGKPYRPSLVEITAGAKRLALDPSDNGSDPLDVDGVKGLRASRLVVRLPPAPAERSRCLGELEVTLAEGPLVFGLPARAVEALPRAVAETTAALRACQKPALRRLARFPIVLRELEVGFAGATRWFVPEPPKSYRGAEALARNCNWLVFPADGDPPTEPSIVAGLGPGLVRVLGAGAAGGPEYWRLAWTDAGWRLVGVDYQIFE
jgi:hypothetical protein